MKLIPFIYNDEDDLMSNTYVVVDDNNNCIVVDPSNPNDGIINFIKKNDYSLKGVFLTHAHFDHIRGVDKLLDTFNVPLYVGVYEEESLTNTRFNGSFYNGGDIVIRHKPTLVCESDKLNLLSEEFRIIDTPFHTSGSICLYFPKSRWLISGDFLFKSSIGRSDLPTSVPKCFNDSIRKIMSLPDDTKVYPGHGKFTTIGIERITNYFVK